MKDLLPEIANLYPTSNDWVRSFPWTYSTGRRDHYETVYYRVTFAADGASTEHKVRVAVPRSIFWNAQAALWDIANQLRQANNQQHARRRRAGNAKRMRTAG